MRYTSELKVIIPAVTEKSVATCSQDRRGELRLAPNHSNCRSIVTMGCTVMICQWILVYLMFRHTPYCKDGKIMKPALLGFKAFNLDIDCGYLR